MSVVTAPTSQRQSRSRQRFGPSGLDQEIYSATATPEAKIPGRPWTFRASGRSWYTSLTATAGPAARMSR